jgi:uncharacterized protein YcfJ
VSFGYAHFSADESFQREGCKHVEAKAKTSDVDKDVILGEVVENVRLGLIGEDEEAGEGHEEACDEGKGGGDVGHLSESI